ncbi:response regulator [Flavobacterium sp. UMI-01]|uniref:tetratricopeptide repeat-containing hybrid sensor histidine kinase/response regulator n=1 Tax=Flavobacterium sp. UMI-01 TaxID=1441053 RepID=UPI001C7D92FC|nr:response regulator [Flavobacterium sp. UMI-01]GIZ08258.1 histidine kinase [Flavobacterium sp. UMI-01]
MQKLRFLLIILFSGFVYGNDIDTTHTTLSRKEILKLANEASEWLHESNFEKSFSASRIVLHYAFAKEDNFLIAKSYNTIGANYEQLSEYDKAISYYKKGLVYAMKAKNDTVKNWINNNLGNIYCFEKRDYKLGISYLDESLRFYKKNKDSTKIVLTKLNIAWAYFDIKLFEEGKPYLEFVNQNSEKFLTKPNWVILNVLNGMYYGYVQKHEQATASFLKAIALGIAEKNRTDLSITYQEYSNYLFKIGDYKKAYDYLIKYNKLSKEIQNDEKLKRAQRVGVNVELDEYKRKVESITAVNVLQNQSLKKSKIIVVLFIVVIGILLLQLYTLYKNYIFKKNANKELTLTNAELIVAKQKADEASRLKSQFVSTITHELRTPLYGVVGITNMLLEEHKELENSPHLNSLKFSARYLLSLINDVLQINKIEENRIVLEDMTFNISDEIEMIITSLSFIAKNHNNTIEVEIDPAIPELLIGDKLRFSQIVINLFSNALKFTHDGKVSFFATLIKIDGNQYFIEFKIKDTGIGIANEDLEKVFDKFTQVGRKDIDYQGTGLGLPIVKKLLELFDSTVSVKSELGKGTIFSFTIPFEYDPQKTNEIINNIEVDLTDSQFFKVLVVDDNNINRLVTQKTIEKRNYKCEVVGSGKDAIELLKNAQFDVILMDINMPEMNGFEASQIIRAMGITTPIIALTAFSKDEITEKALSVGMNDIIVKPYEAPILFKVINQLILKR